MENTISTSNTISREDFLKSVGIGFGAIILSTCVSGCTTEAIPDPINPGGTKFDVTLDLTKAENANLNTNGGYVVFTSGGNKIITAKLKDGSSFLAVQASCTHQGVELKYDSNNNLFTCPLHGSIFQPSGAVAQGPAAVALKKYSTSFDATAKTLRVFES